MKKTMLLFLLLSSFVCEAATYYAAPNGGPAATCVDNGSNVCTLNRAVSVAGDLDSIILTAGTYVGTQLGSAGYVLLSSETPDLTCATVGACILQPSVSTGAIRFNTPPDNSSSTITGVVIDGVNGTSPNYCFHMGDDATGTYTVNIVSSTCMNPVFYGAYVAATGLNLTMTNVVMTATNTARAFLYLDRTTKWAAGTITISGGSATLAAHSSSTTGVIDVSSNAAGLTASVTGWSGFITLAPNQAGNGEHPCIQLLNVANSSITNSYCSVGPAVGNRTTALFRINSCGNLAGQGCSGTETPRAITSATIRGNTGVNNTNGGYGAIIGQDGTSSADNQITGATIRVNKITCNYTGSLTHAFMNGYMVGGSILSNYARGCGINYISKKVSTTPTLMAGNVSVDAQQQHFRTKGSLTTFGNNAAIALTRTAPLFYADVETVSGTQSTVSLYNNIGFALSGIIPTYNVFVGVGDTLSVANKNDWYGSTSWHNNGTPYSSLSTWNAVAAVGTDIDADPLFAKQTYEVASDFALKSSSTLRRAGVCFLASGCVPRDVTNRRATVPPHIGPTQN